MIPSALWKRLLQRHDLHRFRPPGDPWDGRGAARADALLDTHTHKHTKTTYKPQHIPPTPQTQSQKLPTIFFERPQKASPRAKMQESAIRWSGLAFFCAFPLYFCDASMFLKTISYVCNCAYTRMYICIWSAYRCILMNLSRDPSRIPDVQSEGAPRVCPLPPKPYQIVAKTNRARTQGRPVAACPARHDLRLCSFCSARIKIRILYTVCWSM